MFHVVLRLWFYPVKAWLSSCSVFVGSAQVPNGPDESSVHPFTSGHNHPERFWGGPFNLWKRHFLWRPYLKRIPPSDFWVQPGLLQKYSPTTGVPMSFKWFQLSWTELICLSWVFFPRKMFTSSSSGCLSCSNGNHDRFSRWSKSKLGNRKPKAKLKPRSFSKPFAEDRRWLVSSRCLLEGAKSKSTTLFNDRTRCQASFHLALHLNAKDSKCLERWVHPFTIRISNQKQPMNNKLPHPSLKLQPFMWSACMLLTEAYEVISLSSDQRPFRSFIEAGAMRTGGVRGG